MNKKTWSRITQLFVKLSISTGCLFKLYHRALKRLLLIFLLFRLKCIKLFLLQRAKNPPTLSFLPVCMRYWLTPLTFFFIKILFDLSIVHF